MKFKKNMLKVALLLNIAVFGLSGQNSYADALDAEENVIENQDNEIESTQEVSSDQADPKQEENEYVEENIIENQNYNAQNTARNSQTLNRDPKIEDQIKQLQLAVDDEVNVVNSNAYYNYASQELKADYEAAIKNAKAVLARKDSASYEDLRNAMTMVNTAKQNISKQVNQQAQKENKKKQLNEAIKRNQTTIAAAKQLKNLMPNSSKKFEKQLNALMVKSETLIARANQMLKSL